MIAEERRRHVARLDAKRADRLLPPHERQVREGCERCRRAYWYCRCPDPRLLPKSWKTNRKEGRAERCAIEPDRT